MGVTLGALEITTWSKALTNDYFSTASQTGLMIVRANRVKTCWNISKLYWKDDKGVAGWITSRGLQNHTVQLFICKLNYVFSIGWYTNFQFESYKTLTLCEHILNADNKPEIVQRYPPLNLSLCNVPPFTSHPPKPNQETAKEVGCRSSV